jgi:uncharacterized RDD family membrane protein YckC
MQACSCGVAHDDNSNTCPLSRSQSMIQEAPPTSSIEESITNDALVERTAREVGQIPADSSAQQEPVETKRQTSTLIEFPLGRPVPEWRKQLSQRVREVQERKAREAAEEAAAAQEAGTVSCVLPSAQLELVPDLEQPSMNPIVSKALERLERARHADHVSGGYTATAAAPALSPEVEVAPEPEPIEPESMEPKIPETKHKLTVVAPAKPVAEPPARKPIRVISENVDDVALSYLESCLSMPAIDSPSRNYAGLMRRTIAGFFDLLLVAMMISPVAALIEFTDGNWSDPRVIGLMSGVAAVAMFAYHTISIALTGRTLAMRMFSMRTIDIRTNLIPTGGQSLKRAFGYIFSLIPLGLGLLYALIDPDGRAIHDRVSKTAVVRS